MIQGNNARLASIKGKANYYLLNGRRLKSNILNNVKRKQGERGSVQTSSQRAVVVK